MNLSISSSERRNPWKRFFLVAIGCAIGLACFVYLFIAIVDPFDTLPLSPPFDRPPVATNARYSFPALARDTRFDSAILGTSTSRLLRPETLNGLFATRFANLSMNSATAYEQYKLLQVFARAHPAARAVLMGLDVVWCTTGDRFEKYTPRPFPEWMYRDSLWPAYLEMFNYYTIEQAAKQFMVIAGLRPPRYGRDGYTDFLPKDADYDLVRARLHLQDAPAMGAAVATTPSSPASSLNFPTHTLLAEAMAGLSQRTLKILFFVPYHVSKQSPAGSATAVQENECKRRISAIAARVPNTVVVDFMIPSPLTTDDSHYWDGLHYRVPVAERLGNDLAAAANGEQSSDGDYDILYPPGR